LYTFTLLSVQSPRHRKNRQMVSTHKSVCRNEDVTVFWNQGVYRDREVTANRPDIIIKNTN